jgi:diacylglycerol O-acyltransferase / trehalose O-mycolyltransferase
MLLRRGAKLLLTGHTALDGAVRSAAMRGRQPGVRRCVCVALALAAAACGGSSGGHATPPSPSASAQSAAGITAVQRRRIDARLQEWTLRTPALADPTGVRVLLPAGYAAHPAHHYPVLYLLHGADADYRAWTRYGDAEDITAHAPLIVVMPDGGTDGWYTDWYVGEKTVQPRWETYHVTQLIPWIDAQYRTIAAPRGRAIAGLSMGGFGALTYAARHPGTYAAAASFSGALDIGSEAAWGAHADQAARWRAHLPIDQAGRLRVLKLLVLRTGNGRPGPLDRPGTPADCDACGLERFLHGGNLRLHERLRALRIRHVWDDYGPGTHDWPYWRRDLRETLPALIHALGTSPA